MDASPEPGYSRDKEQPCPNNDDADGSREARTGRLLPGEGVLPLAELVAALPEGAPLAVEAPCRATADLPAAERAKRAFHALSALLKEP